MGAEASAAVSGVAAGLSVGNAAFLGAAAGPLGIAAAILITAITYTQIKEQERKADAAQRQADLASSGARGQAFRHPIAPRTAVYGQSLVSGPVVFMHTTDNNNTLHMVIAVASHEVESFDAFYIDNEHVPMVDAIDRTVPGPTRDNVMTPAEGSRLRGKIFITPYKGTDDQPVSDEMLRQINDQSIWSDGSDDMGAHQLRGIAYIYVRALYDKNVFSGGIPNIGCVIKGRKCYDPRTPTLPARWTDNSGLILRDFFTNPDWGLGFSNDEIDDTQFIAAANRADVLIRLATRGNSVPHSVVPFQGAISPAADGYIYLETGQQYIHNGDEIILSDTQFLFNRRGFASTNGAGGFRVAPSLANARAGTNLITIPANTPVSTTRINGLQYTINGVVNTSDRPSKTLISMLDAQDLSFAFVGGKVRLIPPTAPVKTGAYATGGNLIDESHIISGGFNFKSAFHRRDQVNTIKGVYTSPANEWQPTDYPQVALPQANIDAQGGELVTDLPLPFTISYAMAQRISSQILRNEQYQRTVSFAMGLRGLRFQIGDFIYIRRNVLDRIGAGGRPVNLFTDIPFRITAMNLTSRTQGQSTALAVNISAREHPTTLPRWSVNDELPITLAPPVTLPEPGAGLVPPTSLTLESGNNTLLLNKDGTVTSRLRVEWGEAPGGFATGYELGHKESSAPDTEWTTTTVAETDILANIAPVEDGVQYDVRMRSVGANGLKSEYIRSNNHIVLGKTERPPTPLTPLDVSTLPNGTRLFRFDITTAPPDVQHGGGGILIRYSDDLSAPWESMTLLRDAFRASPYDTPEIPEGEYRFAIKWVDSSGNESEVARFSTHTLGRQNIGETFLQRRERDPANDWGGTLGATTVKVARSRQFNQLMATLPSGTNWNSLASTWAGIPGEWENSVYTPNSINYTTPVIRLANPLTFATIVNMEYEGFIHTRTVRYGTALTSGGAIASPRTVTFEEGQPTNIITAQYVQVIVQIRPAPVAGGQPRRNAILRDIDITLSGETIEYKYNDINTATSTQTGFARVTGGGFTFEHLGGAGSISEAIITIQGSQTAATGGQISARLLNKNALTSPRVGAEIGIFNSSNALTNATIDVVLRGPRRGVVRNPVDDSG